MRATAPLGTQEIHISRISWMDSWQRNSMGLDGIELMVTLELQIVGRGCSSNLAAGLRAAFVLALLKATAIAVHIQDVNVVSSWSNSAPVSRSKPSTSVYS